MVDFDFEETGEIGGNAFSRYEQRGARPLFMKPLECLNAGHDSLRFAEVAENTEQRGSLANADAFAKSHRFAGVSGRFDFAKVRNDRDVAVELRSYRGRAGIMYDDCARTFEDSPQQREFEVTRIGAAPGPVAPIFSQRFSAQIIREGASVSLARAVEWPAARFLRGMDSNARRA